MKEVRHTFASALPALFACVALLLACALLTACGDDEGSGTTTASESSAGDTGGGTVEPAPPSDPGGVTSTTLDPGSETTIPDLPDNDDPAAVQCTGEPQGVFDATAVVGEPIADATAAARAEGCEVRVVVRDGRPLPVTEDFRPDRVNVAVADGTVKRIEGLG